MAPPGFRGHPRPPGGSGDDPECIFVITEVCGTTLLNNIFPYHQLLKWPPGAPPPLPSDPGGSSDDAKHIFVITEAYVTTSISNICWFGENNLEWPCPLGVPPGLLLHPWGSGIKINWPMLQSHHSGTKLRNFFWFNERFSGHKTRSQRKTHRHHYHYISFRSAVSNCMYEGILELVWVCRDPVQVPDLGLGPKGLLWLFWLCGL